MKKDELIVKQQLKLERCKVILKNNIKLKKDILSKFYSIGAPLNDNLLQFNKAQVRWCFEVIALLEQLNIE